MIDPRGERSGAGRSWKACDAAVVHGGDGDLEGATHRAGHAIMPGASHLYGERDVPASSEKWNLRCGVEEAEGVSHIASAVRTQFHRDNDFSNVPPAS